MVEEEKNNLFELDFSQSVGDPMVEIGRLGLIEFCGKDKFNSFDELESLLRNIFKLYIEKMTIKTKNKQNNRNSLTMYWLNNPISYGKNINRAIINIEEVYNSSIFGKCHCCGNNRQLGDADRKIYPLSFASTNSNFGRLFLSGIKLCPVCYISLYGMPLNMQKTEGKIAFLIGNKKINDYWKKINLRYIRRIKIDINEYDIINSNIDYFDNFIYWNILKITSKNISFENISFYIFSNMGNEVSIDIKNIDDSIINFIHTFSTVSFSDKLRLQHKKIWNSLIAKHFIYLKYKNDLELIKIEKKNETIIKPKKALKKEKNRLISRFVRNENIFYLMKNDLEKEMIKVTNQKERQTYINAYISLIFKYLKEVRKMNKERLDFLKKLANNLASLENGNKILSEIGRCKKVSDFRMILIKNMETFYKSKQEKLFSVEDFVYKVFPKDEYFSETRDILIVAMYEVLADKLVKEELEITKTIEENEYE